MRKTLLIFLAFLFTVSVTVYGDTVPFAVRTEIPENQVDTQQTYFDLHLMPQETQSIYMEVSNSSEEEISLKISLHPATTGRNGVIIYSEPEELDDSLKIPITEVAELRQEKLTLAAGVSELIQIDIQMPDEEFDGVILGGISVGLQDSNDANNDISGINISNDFVYITALQISQNDNKVEPELHFKSLEPALINYNTALEFKLQNSEPLVMTDVEVRAKVYEEGSDEVFKEYENLYSRFAPNSTGKFVIDWQGENIESGKYRVLITANYEDKDWKWDEEINISTEDVTDINDDSVSVSESRSNLWMTIIILSVIALAVIYYLIKRKSDNS